MNTNTTKLTLSIPKKVLLDAKHYSRVAHRPLSQLVSEYFTALSKGLHLPKNKKQEISPQVLRVTGLAKTTKQEKELLWEVLSQKYRV